MPDPDAVAGAAALTATAGAYALGLDRIWRRAGSGRVVRRWQANAFAAGLVVTAAATLGPLPAGAATSLTAHMVQHVLLLGVAAPLLALGTPLTVFLIRSGRGIGFRGTGFPPRFSRRGMGWAWAVAGAMVVHTVTTVAWHWPPAYDAAATNGLLHLLQHATFLLTGVAFWWLVVGARRRTRAIGGFAALFANSLVSTALGAWLALAAAPAYRSPTAGVRTADALADQQMAGVVMWAFGGTLSLVAAIALFAAWLAGMESESPVLVLGDADGEPDRMVMRGPAPPARTRRPAPAAARPPRDRTTR